MSARPPFPPGSLAVVAVPLGDPGDIGQRALAILGAADLVAAEDTRSARRLLKSHGIEKPLVSYHDWNEAARARTLLARLKDGLRVALVSEAGTPAISDPGFDLVRAARQAGVPVFPVPGPSALAAFLSVSGLPTDAFSFYGFPPNRQGKRQRFFEGLAARPETLVFYESPHRVAEALGDALAAFGDREAALGREMTKEHEEFLFGTLSGLLAWARGLARVRGEITWGIRGAGTGAPPPAAEAESLAEDLARAAREDRPVKEAAREIAARHGRPVKEIYAKLSQLRASSEA